MADSAKIRAELEILGQEGVEQLNQRLDTLKSFGPEIAAALGRGEVSAQEAEAEFKILAGSIKNLEAALRALTAAQEAQAEEARQTAEAAEDLAAAEREAVTAAERYAAAVKRQSEAEDLAHQAEMEAAAILHETEMMAHAERQLEQLRAAKAKAAAEDLAQRVELEALAIEHETAMLAHQAQQWAALEAEEARQLGIIEQQIGAEKALANELFAEAGALGTVTSKMKVTDEATGTFITTTDRATAALARSGGAAGKAGIGVGNLQQSIVAGSFAFQDFTATSGDLGAKLNSITNNLPNLLIGLGGIGIALSVAATAGVAVYRNWDSIAGLWEDRNPFPKAAHDVDGLKRELDRAKESMEKFEKAGSGSAASIEKYNELRAKTAQLEKQIADEQERQAAIKKFTESRTEEQEGRGKAFEEATKGKGAETQAKITEAFRKEQDREIQSERVGTELRVQAIRQSQATDEEKARLAQEEWNKFQAIVTRIRNPVNDPAKLAEQLIVDLMKGEERAGRSLKRLMDETGLVWDGLAERMEALNPETKKKNQQLNEQGQEGEKAALKELEAIKQESKASLSDHLEAMKELGGVAQIAQGLAAESKTKGLSGQAQLDFVRGGVGESIKGGLGVRGFEATKGIDIDFEATVNKAAAGYAKAALGEKANKEAEKPVDQVVKDFAPKLKEGLVAAAAGATAEGKTPEQARAAAEAQARKGLEGGQVAPELVGPAAQQLAARAAAEAQARQGARVAQQPGAEAPAAPARRRPGKAAPRRKVKPPPKPKAVKPPKLTPQQRAAQAVAEAAQRKAAVPATKEDRDALIAKRAKQVQQQSQFFTGMQLDEGQSGDVAKRSVDLQSKGLSANQATMQAMQEALTAMAKLGNEAAKQSLQAQRLGKGFAQVAQRSDTIAPPALNSGYGAY